MATKRLFQLLAAVEDQPGVVASGLVALANAKILVSDPQITYDRETYERNINRTSMTPLTPLEGVVQATCSFRVEMAGTTSAAGTAPDWGILLQACGFKQQTLGVLTGVGAAGSAADGAIYSGETVTSNFSGSPTSEAVHDMWDGSTRYYYAAPSAALTGTTLLSGGTSTANFPVTAGTDTATHGVCWRPVSRPTVTMNSVTADSGAGVGDVAIGQTGGAVFQITEISGQNFTGYLLDVGEFVSASEDFTFVSGGGGFTTASSNFISQVDWPALSLGVIEDGVQRLLTGCRGSVTFAGNIGEPLMMDFEFRGLISSISDGQLSGTPSPTAKVPPSFLEIGYGVAKDTPLVAPADEHTACVTSWSLEYRNEIAIERCAASTDGTRGSAFASGRSVTGSIDPSVRPEGSFAWLDAYRNGTTFRQRLTLGSTAANQFHFSVPACQLTSEGGGDRDGLATRDLQYSASGKNAAGVDGEDREVVISYHQAATFTR